MMNFSSSGDEAFRLGVVGADLNGFGTASKRAEPNVARETCN